MTRPALARAALATLAALAASCNTTAEPYHVAAVANLAPVAAASGRPTTGPLAEPISGPIEALDTGEAAAPPFEDNHVVAAYHVHLADGAAPWVRIFAAASCDAPGDAPQILADVGTLRRVNGETHFFTRHVEVAGKLIDVDTQTAVISLSLASAPFSQRSVLGALAVVLVPGDEAAPTGPGSGGGSGSYSPAGPWLACGVFVSP